MELKVFTLPTCPSCPLAKTIASEVASELGILYREINMATQEGLTEGLGQNVFGTPSFAIDNEVIARGIVLSKDRLKQEVRRKLTQG
jgi:glutaredoxin